MDKFTKPVRRQLDNISRAASRGGSRRSPHPETLGRPIFEYKRPNAGRQHKVLRRVLLSLLGTVLLVGIFFGVKVVLAGRKVITRNNSGGAPALAGTIDPTKLKGEGDGRVNILLLGIGGPGHEGPYLSDTMMLVSIDPQTKDVAMLSIPRDLWVPIPGYGYAKINAADSYGETEHYPGGGGALAKATVSKVFDIPVHYYIRVDFSAFKQAVDTVGGVDINVDKSIYDPYYPCDRGADYCLFSLHAGPQHMTGTIALRYARSRETSSDFDRAARQQKVLVALREKALTLQTLSNPVKVSGLIDSVGNHVVTDLQPNELQRLAGMVKDIDTTKIIQKVLDTSPAGLLVDGNIGGGYVELPRAGAGNYEDLREFVHSIFVDHYITTENAAIQIQNGTTRSGLATAVAKMLKGYNYNITGAVSADNQNYPNTIIYDYTGGQKPYTIGYLENRFGVKAKRATPAAGDPEIRIILGSSYKLTP